LKNLSYATPEKKILENAGQWADGSDVDQKVRNSESVSS
jgi:hypothetical protein